MQRDYYAFQQDNLRSSLNALERASQAFEEAKRQNDKKAQNKAKNQMEQAAKKAAKIEPHLAYLWFWAKKEEADREKRKNEAKRASECANSIRDAWRRQITITTIPVEFVFTPKKLDLEHLPPHSFVISFQFTLVRSFISKNDDVFYIIDNPLRKEKVFQTPMVASTGWKGALRAALWQLGYKEDHETTIRLFGNPRESEEQQTGRLHFYPTFFDRIGLEVINPHSRGTGAGEQPIYFESVPPDAKGPFTLLYVPFDRIGKDEAETRRQVAEDLERVAEGLQAMFTTYGFGAKTSSGYGVAEDGIKDGRILTNVLEAVPQAQQPEEPTMPDVLRTFLENFPNEDFSLKPNEWRKQRRATNTQRNQYKAARNAFREYQEAQNAYKAELEKWEIQTKEPEQHYLEGHFEAFSDLISVVKGISQKIRIGGAV